MSDLIGFFDTETTGLPRPMGAPLKNQPYITEIYIAICDGETLTIQEDFYSLIKPPIPIPEYITKITGIDDLEVYNAPPMKKVLKKIRKKLAKVNLLVAQNFMFDKRMLDIEAKRLGKEIQWPVGYCVVEQSLFFAGRRLKQQELSDLHPDGKSYVAHRAKEDVSRMKSIYNWVKGA